MQLNNEPKKSEVDVTTIDTERLADLVADKVADKLRGEKKLVDREELSDIIGISVPSIDRHLKHVPRVKIGRRVKYNVDHVLAALMDGGTDIG